MNTNHPTKTIYFVFAFTYCHIEVYEMEAEAMESLLAITPRVEMCDFSESDKLQSQKIDTPLLAHLIVKAIPKLIENVLPEKKEILDKVTSLLKLDAK